MTTVRLDEEPLSLSVRPTYRSTPDTPVQDLYKKCFPSRDLSKWDTHATRVVRLKHDQRVMGAVQVGPRWVGWLAIHPNFRGHGLGTLLARTALRMAGRDTAATLRESPADLSRLLERARKNLWRDQP